MTPFAGYLDCINCGNELTNINELTLRTPDMVECDFCGQEYPGLSKRIKRVKALVSFLFILAGALIFIAAIQMAGFTRALFAIFPVFILYIFVLGIAVRYFANSLFKK